MAARVFAVLAAVFLVVAVGIVSLTRFGLTLAHGLLNLDPTSVGWLRGHSPVWTWDWVLWPFLQRPLWLLPACFGLVCAGLALSLNLGKASPSRRRRS